MGVLILMNGLVISGLAASHESRIVGVQPRWEEGRDLYLFIAWNVMGRKDGGMVHERPCWPLAQVI
ncbi:MAG: hypothetical protein NPIRA06_05280 [Nitrospirales bacterium]|nr:MAG: hypothetical protein NPIRA06_05280 [Nitrospirales bacterium]